MRRLWLVLLMSVAAFAARADDNVEANRLLVDAVVLVRQAETAPIEERVALLRRAIANLKQITTEFTGSDLAVRILTEQPIGSFRYDALPAALADAEADLQRDRRFRVAAGEAETQGADVAEAEAAWAGSAMDEAALSEALAILDDAEARGSRARRVAAAAAFLRRLGADPAAALAQWQAGAQDEAAARAAIAALTDALVRRDRGRALALMAERIGTDPAMRTLADAALLDWAEGPMDQVAFEATLRRLVPLLIDARQWAAISDAISLVADPLRRAAMARFVVGFQSSSGLLEAATRTALAIESPFDRAAAVLTVAAAAVRQVRGVPAGAGVVGDIRPALSALEQVLPVLLAGAAAAADRVAPGLWRDSLRSAVAVLDARNALAARPAALPGAVAASMADSTARGVDSPSVRAQALGALAIAAADAGLFARAVSFANGIAPAALRAASLAAIGERLARDGDRDGARSLLEQALGAAEAAGVPGQRDFGLAAVATSSARAGLLTLATEALRRVDDPAAHDAAALEVAVAGVRRFALPFAMATAGDIDDPRLSFEALIAGATGFPPAATDDPAQTWRSTVPAYLPTKFTGDLADAVDTAAATAEPGERAARLMAIANAALDLRAELDPPSEALVEAAILWHRLPAAAAALADLPAGPARTRAAGLLGSALLAAGDRDVAVALAASLGGDPAADVILVLVGLSQTAAGSPKAALRFAVGLSDQSRRSLVLEAIADAELGAGDLPGARAAASLIADETARTAIFEAVVTQALRGDRVDEARAAVLALPPAAQAAALQAIVDALVAPPADPAASGPSASAEDAPRTPAAVAPVVETGVFDILPATRMPIIDGGIIRSPISCQRSGPSAIGVVVTDLGLSSSRTRLAIDTLPQAVAFAFDPYALDPVAIDDAREGGHAILAMAASVGEGFDDPGPFALDPEATVAENGDRLAWTLERVPEAIGVVLSDSAASASSGGVAAALRSAAGSPMLVAVGDIEVGLPDETGSYTTLFAEAGEQARRRGRAIVTVAPYPAALAYLSEWLGRLPADGLALVPVTQFARGARPGEAAADPAGCPTFPP